MKSYSQFVSEAYSSQQSLGEVFGLGLLAKGLTKAGGAVSKFTKYAGRRGIGAGLAGYSLAKGDLTGTGLGIASMLPGPIGPLAMGANLVRSLRGDNRISPGEGVKTPPPPPPPAETKPDQDQTKSEKTPEEMGKEIERIQNEVQKKIDSGEIKNPFNQPKTEPTPPVASAQTSEKPKKRTYKDIRDRDISARASYDPRYDKR